MASHLLRQSARRLQQLTYYHHESIRNQFMNKSRTSATLASIISTSKGHSSKGERSRCKFVGTGFTTNVEHDGNISNTMLQTHNGDMNSVIRVADKDLKMQDLLNLVKLHGQNFDGQQVKDVIQLYRQLTVSESAQKDLGDIDIKPFFDVAIRKAQIMDDKELVLSLFHLAKSGLHQNSAIMQTYLRQAENRMNDMGIYELAVLCRALDCLPKNQQVSAMLQAVAILSVDVIDNAVSPSLLASIMLSTYKLQPLEVREKFETRMVASLHVQKNLELNRIWHIFNTFAKLGVRLDPVLDFASVHVIRHKNIETATLMEILAACEKLDYYNPHLLEHSANIIADNVHLWSFSEISTVFSAYSALKFLNKPLLEKIANRITRMSKKEPEKFNDIINQLAVCARLLSPYGMLNVHPFPERYLVECIEQRTLELLCTVLNPKTCGYVIEVVYYATLMGSFPVKLLQFIFSQECEALILREVDNRRLERRREMVREMHRAVNVECDEKVKSKLQLNAVSKVLQIRRHLPDVGKLDRKSLLQLSLQDCLSSVLGDLYNVELNVTTDMGYHIDCLVTKPQNETQNSNSEESKKRLAVLLAPDSFYANNSLEETNNMWLLGNHVAKERQLKKLGYDVIWIPVRKWAQLRSKDQKLNYLKSQFSLNM